MTTKTTAKAANPAKAETPNAPLDLTADLLALTTPRPFGGANARPIPPEIEQFVEDAHEAWRKNPYGWQFVTLSGAEAVDEVFQLARIYAARRGTPVTVQRKKSDNPAEFVYRVRDKIRQTRRATVTAVTTEPAPIPTEA